MNAYNLPSQACQRVIPAAAFSLVQSRTIPPTSFAVSPPHTPDLRSRSNNLHADCEATICPSSARPKIPFIVYARCSLCPSADEVAFLTNPDCRPNTPIRMKSVCIIGAGPAGLVAAKTFLQKGGYTVTVFETADRVGGMWRAQPGEHGDKCSPEMRTNLSRFTVAFSDLAWSSVDLSHPKNASSQSLPPTFPKAWQVGRYLAKYAEKFGVDSKVMYNKRISRAHPIGDYSRWEVTSIDQVSKEQNTQTFDYLVVASGFFDRPTHSLSSPAASKKTVQHSSQFRTLSGLSESAGTVAIIGGGISGSEAAAQAAFQISSAKHSPGKEKPIHANSTIYHIINRPFYCLPRYIPQETATKSAPNAPAPCFLPLDLVLYNLSRRGGGDITAAISTVPPEKAEQGHQFLRSMIGGDQAETGHSALVYGTTQIGYPAYTGITDTYLEFVRSGVIVPVQGWVTGVEEDAHGRFTIGVVPKAPWADDSAASSVGTPRRVGICRI